MEHAPRGALFSFAPTPRRKLLRLIKPRSRPPLNKIAARDSVAGMRMKSRHGVAGYDGISAPKGRFLNAGTPGAQGNAAMAVVSEHEFDGIVHRSLLKLLRCRHFLPATQVLQEIVLWIKLNVSCSIGI